MQTIHTRCSWTMPLVSSRLAASLIAGLAIIAGGNARIAAAAEAAARLRVQYRCGEERAETNTVRFQVQILNESGAAVAMKDLSVRYWYADDSGKPQNFWCDWAKVDKQNVTGQFVTLDKPVRGAACYLELIFGEGAGTIAADGSSGEVQCRFARNDWSNYNQADDYSFDANAKQWTENSRVTLYQRGKLVWGQEPTGAKASPAKPSPGETRPAQLPPSRVPIARRDAKYEGRFLELWTTLHDPKSGYFSPEGIPYHSVETFMIEAPDHGHETTSEAASYWLWLEAKYGHLTGDWSKLAGAWEGIEKHFIPTVQDQPGNAAYNPAKPGTYAAEFDTPAQYPSPMRLDVAVGQDPIADELRRTYRSPNIYGMHWLVDVDNWYGYGRRGDGTSRPSYINTFQRGPMESVWATVPHPSWEDFKWGGRNGFLDLFVGDKNYARQWRYTNAPDADARAVQAMFWAYEWAAQRKEGDKVPLDKAAKLGDYLRYALFDKYFMKPGCRRPGENPGRGYESAHYLLSWYYAWGGAMDGGWAWRIGCSHAHSGYQNPLAAWILANHEALKPASPNAPRDWQASLARQLELYRWLQSAEGAIAGGATNSWLGRYETPPANAATFYGMAYDWQPVYHDPPSNNWFGMQAWTMCRVAEYYYVTGDKTARELLAKWAAWAMREVKLGTDGGYEVPMNLNWKGQPDTWDATAPGANPGLHVSVVDRSPDVGVAAALARTLLYFSAAEKRWARPDPRPAILARQILDRMWKKYRDDRGLSAPEPRPDYKRVFEFVIHVPPGWSGKMANGDAIKPGVKFLDIRSRYRDDPVFAQVERAYRRGVAPVFRYHRFWAQVEVALANAAAAELDTGESAGP